MILCSRRVVNPLKLVRFKGNVYLVFARKYRPQRFEEVVGQAHIATTLQNAVKNGRVGHAYLFCGSRGIGKTTMARILAKALNCEKGPTPQPCGECDSCLRIATGDDLDVLEIDGASNRGIEQIRELRQNIGYAPAHSRCKIYYIDEVHMLTQQAFNALLKSLEEPPSHVKFIFSTTDPQQLPDTVKSRCQRFNFRRISDAEIIKHLRSICTKEGLEAQKGSLEFIARAARGSMRDALGTLDQLASFDDKQVRLGEVLSVLGAAEAQELTEIIDSLARGETGRALSIVHEILSSGVDVLDFTDQLSQYTRDLLIASYCSANDELLAGAMADDETLSRQSELFSPEQLVYMIQILREAKLRARRETTGRLALEVAIVKLSRLGELAPLEQALQQLSVPAASSSPSPDEAPARHSRPPDSAVSKRIRNMKQKLQNRSNAAAQGEEIRAPEGMDPAKFRQIQGSAADIGAAEELRKDQPLLKAFVEADQEFGLTPVRLRRRQHSRQEKPQDNESNKLAGQ